MSTASKMRKENPRDEDSESEFLNNDRTASIDPLEIEIDEEHGSIPGRTLSFTTLNLVSVALVIYFVFYHDTEYHIQVDPAKINLVSLFSISYDRIAHELPIETLGSLHRSHFGISWDSEDNDCTKWYPRGISKASFPLGGNETRDFLFVSWHAKKEEGSHFLGARVSVIDLGNYSKTITSTRLREFQYRHVLLVDEDLKTIPGFHAGGIEYSNGSLFVTDAKNRDKTIRVFDILNDFYQISSGFSTLLHDYHYVFRQRYSFKIPIEPSFLSYDWNRDQMVTGSLSHCHLGRHFDNRQCERNNASYLLWFHTNERKSLIACRLFFGDMQGAASLRVKFPLDKKERNLLLVVSSNGMSHQSYLHVGFFDPVTDCIGNDYTDYQTVNYPPGLKDVHVEQLSELAHEKMIWMLTEYSSRVIFVTKISEFAPVDIKR